MPKRFTASEKWDDPFFTDLSKDYKLVWIYILDKCSNAGIYDVNIKNLNFSTETTLSAQDILTTFGERILVLNSGKKWFIPKFVVFQYGSLQTEKNTFHKKISEDLRQNGIECREGVYTLLEISNTHKDNNRNNNRKLKGDSQGENPEPVKSEIPTDEEKILAYLNQKTNRNYRVGTGIKSRLETYSFDDLILVIDFKVFSWLNDDTMSEHLCPKTLFRESNFDKYLPAAREWDKRGRQNKPPVSKFVKPEQPIDRRFETDAIEIEENRLKDIQWAKEHPDRAGEIL
jgi:uncharacterized phage protein (TIGR02220 family)